ncbi:MAG: phage holin family protein [Patescibacteria group bacterium]|jgi:putative membrane protein
MKRFIRSVVFYAVAIYLVGLVIPGFKVVTDVRGLILSGLTLSILFTFVKPILHFLLLPINVLTLGLFSFLSSILTFYLFLYLFPSFVKIEPWVFQGIVLAGLKIGTIAIGRFVTVVMSTALISFIVGTISFFL